MPAIAINGVNHHYEDSGGGSQVLLFLHGMLLNLRMFDKQVEYFKGNFRCLRFDFRGQGKSEISKDGYDLDSLSQDTASIIKQLDIVNCHLVGFSMGALVAMKVALKYPGLIKSLVLIGASSEEQPKEDLLQNKLMLLATRFGLQSLFTSKVMSMYFGKSFLNNPENRNEVITWKKYLNANKSRAIIKVARPVLFRTIMTPDLHRIDVPTHLLAGEEDTISSPSMARIIHNHCKSTIEIIPRSGHMLPVEEADLVNQSMAGFYHSIEVKTAAKTSLDAT